MMPKSAMLKPVIIAGLRIAKRVMVFLHVGPAAGGREQKGLQWRGKKRQQRRPSFSMRILCCVALSDGRCAASLNRMWPQEHATHSSTPAPEWQVK
jgi:hypothetical protein